MPWLVFMLFGAFSRFLPIIAARLLTAFGVGLFTAGALSTLYITLKTEMGGWQTRVPASALALMDIGYIPQSIWFIVSCIGVRLAWLSTQTIIKKI